MTALSETDDSFETTADGVYAIGDVSWPPMFTHSARDDADLLYRHLAKDEEISTGGRTVPWGVFIDPQVGPVGLTEREARDVGHEVGIGPQDFADQGQPRHSAKPRGSSNSSPTGSSARTSATKEVPKPSTNSSPPSNSA